MAGEELSERRAAPRARVLLLAALAGVVLACGGGPETTPEPPPSAAWEGLVFLRSTPQGGADVWLGRVSDGAVAPLVETPEVVESSPHWLPSMLRVVYLSRPAGNRESSRLTMTDPETGETSSASEDIGTVEGVASVSPDGKQLVYAFDAPEGQIPDRGVRILDPMSAKQETLAQVEGAEAYLSLSFSPKVTSVVAQIHRTGRGDDVWLLLGGGGQRSLVSNPRWHDAGPRFTHLATGVVFTRSAVETQANKRRREAASRPAPLGGGDICLLDLGQGRVQCTVATKDAREFGVAPSPTAGEQVYVRQRGEEVDLFLSDLQGGNERRLTQTPEPERSPVWSPDGERIAFEAGSPGARHVRVIDREGNVLFDAPGFAPDWSPLLL